METSVKKPVKIDKERLLNFLMDDISELTQRFDRIVNCDDEPFKKEDYSEILDKLFYLESLIVKIQN